LCWSHLQTVGGEFFSLPSFIAASLCISTGKCPTSRWYSSSQYIDISRFQIEVVGRTNRALLEKLTSWKRKQPELTNDNAIYTTTAPLYQSQLPPSLTRALNYILTQGFRREKGMASAIESSNSDDQGPSKGSEREETWQIQERFPS